MHFVFQVAMYIMIKVSLNEAIDELAPFLILIKGGIFSCELKFALSLFYECTYFKYKNFKKAFNIYSNI